VIAPSSGITARTAAIRCGAAATASCAILSPQAGAGASPAIPTSRDTRSNPVISNSIVQTPSGRSGNAKAPFSSVEIAILRAPCTAVTLTPGNGSPREVTVP
jgi:hypothetical protein